MHRIYLKLKARLSRLKIFTTPSKKTLQPIRLLYTPPQRTRDFTAYAVLRHNRITDIRIADIFSLLKGLYHGNWVMDSFFIAHLKNLRIRIKRANALKLLFLRRCFILSLSTPPLTRYKQQNPRRAHVK